MKKYISILFTMFLVFSIHAQSAEVITDILESEKATFGQACYISAVEQGFIDENGTYDMAVEAMVSNNLIPKIVDSNAAIPLGDAVFILSNVWPIKGGLMYRLTKGSPRYCFKQFKSDRVIDLAAEPGDFISGEKLLEIYTIGSRMYGEFDIMSVSMENE